MRLVCKASTFLKSSVEFNKETEEAIGGPHQRNIPDDLANLPKSIDGKTIT